MKKTMILSAINEIKKLEMENKSLNKKINSNLKNIENIQRKTFGVVSGELVSIEKMAKFILKVAENDD